nr:hypothetical protein BaRGS_029845 [Batillaria attramentaria]
MRYLKKVQRRFSIHRRFVSLTESAKKGTIPAKNPKIPFANVLELPELKVNPFKDQIVKVFSSSGDGYMTFEDFLDMMSVFSENAPKAVKVEYAFRIYDFDGDDMISSSDLKEVVTRMIGEENTLDEEKMQQLIDNILEEGDLDDDEALSFAEFEHVISKAPDFVSSFRIRL